MRKMTKLRELRVNRSEPLKLKTLAERLGVSESTLSEIELGRMMPGDQVLARLARYHRKTVAELREICERNYKGRARASA